MSHARRKRRLMQWRRYTDRYITPERGGMLDNVEPIGFVKALFRVWRHRWTYEQAYWERAARRSR